MVLVEPLEAVVDIDGCAEAAGQREGDFAGRGHGVVIIAGSRCAGIVVLHVDFLGGGGGEDESEAEADANGAWVGAGVLKIM